MVLEITKRDRCSLATYLKKHRPEFVGRPNTFISHAWKNKTSRLIFGLEKHHVFLLFFVFFFRRASNFTLYRLNNVKGYITKQGNLKRNNLIFFSSVVTFILLKQINFVNCKLPKNYLIGFQMFPLLQNT